MIIRPQIVFSLYLQPFQHFGISNFVFEKEILLFSKGTLNWSKVTVKTFIMLQKICISNNCGSFNFYSSENPNNTYQFPQKY